MAGNEAIVTAVAHPNIAFIKYWGNRDQTYRIPANGSISMNLGAIETRSTLTRSDSDSLVLNDQLHTGKSFERVKSFLDLFRDLYGIQDPVSIVSSNNFPTGAGIASSASGFAALAVGLNKLFDLALKEEEVSKIARLGSGSACRSVPDGFVEWIPGNDHSDSFARSITPSDHWSLADCIVVVETEHKQTGSTEGHTLANTSVVQKCRIEDTPRRLDICRSAILERDFASLAAIAEQDSDLMHAVMMTSTPPLHYWTTATISIIQKVKSLRAEGMACFYTIDAGSNVHVITLESQSQELTHLLKQMHGVQQVIVSGVGNGAFAE